MEKNESVNKILDEIKPPSRGKMQEYILTILKLLSGICLLPAVYAVTVSFCDQLAKLESQVVSSFTWGVVWFLIFYLFIWEPALLFKKGQKILEVVFRFFAPLVRVAPYVLPIYTILIFIAYLILAPLVDIAKYVPALIFSLGFSFSLHIVFCAKTLRTKQQDKLKAGYIFGFSLIYILDAILLTFFFNLVFQGFSFLAFFNGSYQIVSNLYTQVFAQLFL